MTDSGSPSATETTETRAPRVYYRALDEHDYALLTDALAPDFVHDRPDMTLTGREAFVTFMREERPVMETRHEIRAVFESGDGVAVQGRLLDADGDCLTGFVDVFSVTDGQIERVETYIDTVKETAPPGESRD